MKDRVYLERIKGYVFKINIYTKGIQNVHEFIRDEQKVDAVMLNPEQIGETAKNLRLRPNNIFHPSIGQALLD